MLVALSPPKRYGAHVGKVQRRSQSSEWAFGNSFLIKPKTEVSGREVGGRFNPIPANWGNRQRTRLEAPRSRAKAAAFGGAPRAAAPGVATSCDLEIESWGLWELCSPV